MVKILVLFCSLLCIFVHSSDHTALNVVTPEQQTFANQYNERTESAFQKLIRCRFIHNPELCRFSTIYFAQRTPQEQALLDAALETQSQGSASHRGLVNADDGVDANTALLVETLLQGFKNDLAFKERQHQESSEQTNRLAAVASRNNRCALVASTVVSLASLAVTVTTSLTKK